MKAVVFAYHEIGYVCLKELMDFGAEIQCLFSHEDDAEEEIWFERPITVAREKRIPVYTPDSLKDPKWVKMIRSLEPDIIFSFYYRYIIPKAILDIPRIGSFNLHGSLLPRFRGRCPVNWVIIEGETETGLTLHVMESKADTGDIIIQKTVPVDLNDTAHSLFLKMVKTASSLMKEILPKLCDGTFERKVQTGQSSYYGGRTPEDGLILWDKTARSLYNLIRAVTHPYPGAFTYLNGKKLFIWWATPEATESSEPPGTVISENPCIVSTGEGTLRLLRVELEGEPETDAGSFAVSHKIHRLTLGGKP